MKQPLQKQCNECDYYNEKQTFCNVWQKHKQANTTKCNFYQITNTKRTLNHCEPQMIMPRTDCEFCEIRIFNDIMLDNGACRSQYAVCRNPHFNEGCEIIDFRLLDNPYSVRCQNCKEYTPIKKI